MTSPDNALVVWFTDQEMKDLNEAAAEHGWDPKERARFLILADIAS